MTIGMTISCICVKISLLLPSDEIIWRPGVNQRTCYYDHSAYRCNGLDNTHGSECFVVIACDCAGVHFSIRAGFLDHVLAQQAQVRISLSVGKHDESISYSSQ